MCICVYNVYVKLYMWTAFDVYRLCIFVFIKLMDLN